MEMVNAENLTHSYMTDGRIRRSLNNFSMSVQKGEFLAVLGHNGCGKTTLARHLNVLIPVQKGELNVAGCNAKEPENIRRIRKSCGMVFQNPNNQFVSSVVEEDIAFGPENFGLEESEVKARVKAVLETVGMSGFEKRFPQLLSGGQKQRIAIAGVLAADPEIMVFDEATSMLDPEGRKEVLETIKKLHDNGKTVIMISHYIEEAVFADRVMLVHDGQVLAEGTPREMLTDLELLKRTGLTPTMSVSLYFDLLDRGIRLPECPITNEELVEALCQLH